MERKEFEERWKKVGSPKKAIYIGNNGGYMVAVDYDIEQNYISIFTGELEYSYSGLFRLEDIRDIEEFEEY